MEEVIMMLKEEEEVRTFNEVIFPVLDVILQRIKELDLCHAMLYSYLDVLIYFTRQFDLAKVRNP